MSAGAVYVRSGTVWSLEAYIKAPNVDGSDHIGHAGHAVSLSADTLAVGAY
jgi:hypothetical protein